MLDESIVNDQRGCYKKLIAQVGKKLLEQKSIISITLPIYIFASETLLQRQFRLFHFIPKLTHKILGKNLDKELKLAMVAAHFL